MRLLVPCFESWVVRSTSGRFACKEGSARQPEGKVNSVSCAVIGFAASLVEELLYRDVLRKALSLIQTLDLVAFTKRSD